ncbi:carnosine synthase 1 [Podospora aff. communis PSN243]|uniref:Carnosine synthase 1 n=1 Tax=Podospora aff. communis PSN243 TaxID=3040156 RepID=A0AAV9GS74_9PEZI|nr:carnosine synthase 1 [Podospora aff. communis PSN243]
MAVDVVYGHPAVQPQKAFQDAPDLPPDVVARPTPASATPSSQSADDESLLRPFFWETIRLCELYSVVHVVLLPPSQLATRCACQVQTAVSGKKDRQERQNPSSHLLHALHKAGCASIKFATTAISVFTCILPSADGYIGRSDFLRLRLQDFPFHIQHIHDLLQPLQRYSAIAVDADASLPSLIKHAAGIVQWADIDNSVSIAGLQERILYLTQELKCRLDAAPWLSPEPIARKRVALVRGRPNLTAGGPVYRAAEALGLDLVIISEEGHWLQPETEENKKHREAFISTDMTEDECVANRFVAAVKSYPLPIDGVFTLSDNFFVAVAKAAQALGLPTSPVLSYETSVDKYRSRLLQDEPGKTARVKSVDELNQLLQKPDQFSPSFPLIVKPTKGWSSECVSKVRKMEDLAIAVEKATARHGSAAVIEPFFDGPEMDVNFVLLDGEILFCEIADEPPCQADASSASVHDTFSPEALTMPSALPTHEQDIVRSTLRDILVNIGFRTGIFHVEARMVNSSYEYRDVGGGVIDLVPKKTLPLGEPTCRLIEINARPPGFRVTVPSKQTYGVDYFAAHMLAAVGDGSRLRMIAQPFQHAFPGWSAGWQYWSRLVYVPVPADGTVRLSEGLSPCEELKRRRPDLAEHMVMAMDYFGEGDEVSMYTDGARNYAANILVQSRRSRREAIEMGNEVLRSYRICVEA